MPEGMQTELYIQSSEALFLSQVQYANELISESPQKIKSTKRKAKFYEAYTRVPRSPTSANTKASSAALAQLPRSPYKCRRFIFLT